MAQKQRKPAQRGSNLKPFYLVLAVIAAIGIAAVAWSALRPKPAAGPVDIPEDAAADPDKLIALARGIEEGNDSARVKVLVFSDFMCPACRHFATVVEPQLRTEYINTGKVQLVYYDFPLGEAHRWSFLAARAARCAEDQGKFWPYHDRLFTNQDDWSFEQNSPTSRLEGYAREVGVDAAAFGACLDSDKHAELVSANHTLGTQLGVNSTPTLFMNGRFLPNAWRDYKELKLRVEEELAR